MSALRLLFRWRVTSCVTSVKSYAEKLISERRVFRYFTAVSISVDSDMFECSWMIRRFVYCSNHPCSVVQCSRPAQPSVCGGQIRQNFVCMGEHKNQYSEWRINKDAYNYMRSFTVYFSLRHIQWKYTDNILKNLFKIYSTQLRLGCRYFYHILTKWIRNVTYAFVNK
jgi:hypothetical protein